MGLEGVILSGASQTEKDTYFGDSPIWGTQSKKQKPKTNSRAEASDLWFESQGLGQGCHEVVRRQGPPGEDKQGLGSSRHGAAVTTSVWFLPLMA